MEKCERIQPNLLDYSKGLLTAPEAEEISEHIRECAECAALLNEEIKFANRLESLPVEEPSAEVWNIIQAQTKPKTYSPFAWLSIFNSFNLRKAAVAAVAVVLLLIAFYTFRPIENKPVPNQVPVSQLVMWSDDPMGQHTDAIVEYISNM